MKRTEAIEVIRKNYPHVGFSGTEFETALRELIPELKESKDERIRKDIITYLSNELHNITQLTPRTNEIEAWIAYLEKQKEQKPSTPEDIAAAYQMGLAKGRNEQKPAEWKPQPESLEALMYAIEGKWEMIKPTSYLSRMLEDLYDGLVNTYNVDESLLVELSKTAYTAEDIEELRALKAKIEASMEQRPEERQDYSGLNDLERAIHRGFLSAGVENVPVTIIKETEQDCLAHIDKQWSEEDENLFDLLHTCVCRCINDPNLEYQKRAKISKKIIPFIERLKSIRPSWKPSEEQMKALSNAIVITGACSSLDAINTSLELDSLYEQLKQL